MTCKGRFANSFLVNITTRQDLTENHIYVGIFKQDRQFTDERG